MDAAAKADPVHPVDRVAKAVLDQRQHVGETVKIVILAVVVEHQPGDAVGHGGDLHRIMFAQTAEGAGGVGQIEFRCRHTGVHPQPARMPCRCHIETVQLADGIEDDLVAIGQHLGDLVIVIGH